MMQKLKLTELLLSLTPGEFKKFGDFVRSPFFNKNKKLISLTEYLEDNLPELASGSVTKEIVWKHINPEEEFADTKLRSYLSDLKKLCEKFIMVLESEKNEQHQKNLFLNYLCGRNAVRNFETSAGELRNFFGNEFSKSFDYYYNNILFERTIIRNEGGNVEKNLDSTYYRLSDAIDHFFISSKLDLMNSFLSRKYHVLGSYKLNINFTKEIIEHTEKNLAQIRKNDPFIYCEYLIFKMMTAENNDGYYTDLHSFVLKNIQRYNHSDLEQVYYPMINFGFNKVAMGETEYLKKIFDIYRTFEQRGFYNDMEAIQDIDLISIVIAGLRLNKFSWVEDFTERYSRKLIDEFKTDTINLVKAIISFKKKEYRSAINYLNKVNYQNSYYYLKSKEMLLQIYYEQGEYEAVQSLIDSTRHYLKRRRDVLSIHYDRYTMFLKYIGMLLKAKEPEKRFRIVLKKELKKNNTVMAKEWLMEKADEL